MKNYKTGSTLYFIASLLWYLVALLEFTSGNNNNNGTIYLCLGSAFVCLGSMYAKKAKDNNRDDDEKNE